MDGERACRIQREITATRIALLDLKDEQQLVREGYELLDEKRILLAAEMRASSRGSSRCGGNAPGSTNELRSRTVAAVDRHGIDELSVYPPLTLTGGPPESAALAAVRTRAARGASRAAGAAARLARAAGQPDAGGARLRRRAPQVAASVRWSSRRACVNLRRLVRDYVRTERRARAIENVLMPEIESALKHHR